MFSCTTSKEESLLIFHRSLVKLNLAYNQIELLEGFRDLSRSGSSLQEVVLHGNRVGEVREIVRNMCRLSHLLHLTLSQGGAHNPVCMHTGMWLCLFYH